MWLFMKNPEQGAQTLVYLATEPKLKTVTGLYFKCVWFIKFLCLDFRILGCICIVNQIYLVFFHHIIDF